MIDLQLELLLLLAVGYMLGKRKFISPQTRDQLTDIIYPSFCPVPS